MALSKKKSKELTYDPWRPDFRDMDNLPDTKAIRTDFALNFFSIFFAVLLLGYAAYLEYQMQSYRKEVSNIQEQLDRNSQENMENVGLNGRFTKITNHITEVGDFLTTPYLASELLQVLAEIRPEEMILESVSSQALETTVNGRQRQLRYQVIVVGTIRDSLEKPASSVVTDYQETLRSLNLFQPKLEDINLVRFARNDDLGVFNFTVELIIDPKKES